MSSVVNRGHLPVFFCSLILLVAGVWTYPSQAASRTVATPVTYEYSFVGEAQVVDGQTLSIHGQLIQLLGIEAPAPDVYCFRPSRKVWACGRRARRALMELVEGRRVLCFGNRRDRADTVFATCYLRSVEHESLNARQVRAGWAKPKGTAGEAFWPLADALRKARKGVWSGKTITQAAIAERREEARLRAEAELVSRFETAAGRSSPRAASSGTYKGVRRNWAGAR